MTAPQPYVGFHPVSLVGLMRDPVSSLNAASEDANSPADHQATSRDCVDMTDAQPSVMGSGGKIVPIAAEMTTADLVRLRLDERRLELEALSGGIEARKAILDAAEKRIQERATALEQLQLDIDAALGQAVATESRQLKELVSAYETMKPANAAAIFDKTPDEVLLAIARKMNPRKITPILAKMRPDRAGALTARLMTADE